MSLLMMTFFTLVCLFERYPEPLLGWFPLVGNGLGQTMGLPPLPTSVLVLTLLGVVGVALRSVWIVRGVLGPLTRDPTRRDEILDRYERRRFRHQIVLFAVYLATLFLFGWGWFVEMCWPWSGQKLLLLAPFVVNQFLSWAFFYDADRALQRALVLLSSMPEGCEIVETPTKERGRLSYLLFQARQKFALVFLPVALLMVQLEARRLFPAFWKQWEGIFNLLGFALLAVFFVSMPWIVRILLGLKPLPEGKVRQRLLATANRLGFRCTDILLWNTRHGMANAMVIGILPWLRYVVFTDKLLEDFSEDEVEAVFGHEVGHIKHHHMLYYLGFLTASMVVLGLAVAVVGARARDLLGNGQMDDLLGEAGAWVLAAVGGLNYLEMIPLVVLLVGYIFVVFGFLSRRCERQADIYGCRAVSCSEPTCQGHEPNSELASDGRGLCPTGIRTFISALEKVALVNGISRDRPGFLQSWQHSTIARRVEFLHRMLYDAKVEPRFQRTCTSVKWGLFLALGAVLMVVFCLQ